MNAKIIITEKINSVSYNVKVEGSEQIFHAVYFEKVYAGSVSFGGYWYVCKIEDVITEVNGVKYCPVMTNGKKFVYNTKKHIPQEMKNWMIERKG